MNIQLKPFTLFLASLVLFSTAIAHADLKGEIKVEGSRLKEATSGIYYFKNGLSRIDMERKGHKISTLIDMKNKKVTMLMHSQKMATVTPYDATQHGLECDYSNYLACLKTKGFKQTASESMNGHPCDVYEGDQTVSGEKQHHKFWKAKDLKDPIMVRSFTQKANGDTLNVNIINLKQDSLDASLFTVPADYKNMGDIMKGMTSPDSKHSR